MKKLTLSVFALALAFSASAQLQTKTVSIFKNGQAFFSKEGDVNLQKGTYTIAGEVPEGLFGTLWFVSKNGKIKHIISSQDSVACTREVVNVGDLLKANQGSDVSLNVRLGMQVVAMSGTIERVICQGNSMVYMKTSEGKFMVVDSQNIESISFSGSPKISLPSKEWKRNINIQFADAAAGSKHLGLVYLRNGLGWSPNYLLELQNDTKGRLTLQAEVVNQAEDIDMATVNFVVGSPNFSQATRLSGLVDFNSSSYAVPSADFGYANAAMQQAGSYAYDMGGGAPENDFQFGEGVAGKGAEDMYLYTLLGMKLKKGERAFFTLQEADVEIEHIYEADLSSNQVSSGYYQKDFTPIDTELPKVFHSISLKNTTAVPWTTGAALVMKLDNGQQTPISQDVLRYTPPKGEGTIRLTSAPDIQVDPSEREASREEQKLKGRNGQQYDLVTVEGQIKVKNYKSTPVKLSISRTIQGESIKCNIAWKTNVMLNLSGQINKTTQAKWDVELKPGEEKVIEYSYKVFVGY